jgi:hypothetical protein
MIKSYEDDPQNMEQSKQLEILCYMAKSFDLLELRELVYEIFNSLRSSVYRRKNTGVD